jgi:leucyl-tRNA synthetase
MVAPDIAEPEAKRLAMDSPKTQPFLAGKAVSQCIFVPGKLINLVVK